MRAEIDKTVARPPSLTLRVYWNSDANSHAQSLIPRAVLSEMFEASRVPSGHGFPATIKNPQLTACGSPNSPLGPCEHDHRLEKRSTDAFVRDFDLVSDGRRRPSYLFQQATHSPH